MDTTLVINPGSSSKKYALFVDGCMRSSITFERTKEGYGKCLTKGEARQKCETSTEHEFKDALQVALQHFLDSGVLAAKGQLTAVGLRIVAPGTYFTRHQIIDDTFIEKLRARSSVTPLHIPLLLEEIEVVRTVLPQVPLIGASDSAFHATMPPFARRYSIPQKDADKGDIFRFGYHGLSIASIVRKLPLYLDLVPERVVVAHVGSGVSVTALRRGLSVDTSMGFSPLSGVMMGSRAGDLDPGALIYLLEERDLDDGEAQAYISKHGGLQGLLGTSDLRVALDRRAKGDPCAEEAITLFFSLIKKQIGAMATVLEGIDTLVLTATAPERNPLVRSLICGGLAYLGIRVDEEKNDLMGSSEGFIEPRGGTVPVLVLHTDEMGEVARIVSEKRWC